MRFASVIRFSCGLLMLRAFGACSSDSTGNPSAGTGGGATSSGGSGPSGSGGSSSATGTAGSSSTSAGGTSAAGGGGGSSTTGGSTGGTAGNAGGGGRAGGASGGGQGGAAGGRTDGGSGQPEGGADATTDTWDNYAKGFFASFCVSCHNDDNAGVATRDYHLLANVIKEKAEIACGVATQATWTTRGCTGFPPAHQFPIGNGTKPTDQDRDRLVRWIDSGAP